MSSSINMMPLSYTGYEKAKLLEVGINKPFTSLPFAMLSENQAKINHDQTLARMKERGGIGLHEALALTLQVSWQRVRDRDVVQSYYDLVSRIPEIKKEVVQPYYGIKQEHWNDLETKINAARDTAHTFRKYEDAADADQMLNLLTTLKQYFTPILLTEEEYLTSVERRDKQYDILQQTSGSKEEA